MTNEPQLGIKRLPLYPETSYRYTSVLEDRSFTISVNFNSRAKAWYFDIATEDGIPIIEGVRLVPSFPLLADYAKSQLSGYFILIAKSVDTDREAYLNSPRFLDQYYNLLYVRPI